MDTLQTIQIQRADNGQFVEASIVRLDMDDARKMIDEIWWKLPNVPVTTLEDEGDSHWRWATNVRLFGSGVLEECVAIRSKEDYIEGAVAYNLKAKSRLEPGQGCAYIERLSTAPRNRSWVVKLSLYRGIGSALTYWVVKQSYNAGLGGRVALESLLTSTTIDFYKGKGFVRTDPSQQPPDLPDYELPRAAAEEWLRKKGDLA